MIDIFTFRKIKRLFLTSHLSLHEIAKKLSMGRNTVKKWVKIDSYESNDSPASISHKRVEIIKPILPCNSDIFINTNFNWILLLLLGRVSTSDLANSISQAISLDDSNVFIRHISEGNLKKRTQSLTIIAHLRGVSKHKISSILAISRRTVRKYIKMFNLGGTSNLFRTYSSSKTKMHEQDKYKTAVFSILHSPPSDYGFNRTSWKMLDLKDAMRASGLPINADSLRLIIHNAGYRFRKARKVLTSTDPDYKCKLASITCILSNLKSSESFFSIDEFGPLSVRRRGGRSFSLASEVNKISQQQVSKGRILLTGALELTTNHFTHFYSEKKNTFEMIKLLYILIENYKKQDRIYFSWDAASWHGSHKFNQEVNLVNSLKYRSDNGTPEVVLAPLPSCAQFLNVIESVFSGMARAIIHNSDYASAEDCKTAIDRYFLERNQFFKDNPKRAGDKIWGKERVLPVFNPSNNCKDPLYR